MEFVLVTFPRVRPVRMDGATQGQTGQVIAVQRGVHLFDLGSPLDYAPPSVQTPVANTTSAPGRGVSKRRARASACRRPRPWHRVAAPAMKRRWSVARRTVRRKKKHLKENRPSKEGRFEEERRPEEGRVSRRTSTGSEEERQEDAVVAPNCGGYGGAVVLRSSTESTSRRCGRFSDRICDHIEVEDA